MSITEVTTLVDGVTVISTSERKLFTIDDLKDGDPGAYERALSKLAEWATDWEWWEDTIESVAEVIAERYGIKSNPKDYTFDLYRREFAFGKVYDIDEKKLMRKAGIDLRRRGAKACMDRLVIGIRWGGFGNHSNWIGFSEYEYVPDYVEEMYPGISEMLDEVVRDARDDALKILQDEEDYLTSEEHLVEWAQANEYWWDARGNPA